MIRKYDTDFRKNLKYRIAKITEIDDYKNIFNLIKNNATITQNNNGVYFNLNSIDDNIIEKIVDLLSTT